MSLHLFDEDLCEKLSIFPEILEDGFPSKSYLMRRARINQILTQTIIPTATTGWPF
jgi:hypothetical protein